MLMQARRKLPPLSPVVRPSDPAQAGLILSRDEGLLALGKPFGIEMITPRELLTRLAGREKAKGRKGTRDYGTAGQRDY